MDRSTIANGIENPYVCQAASAVKIKFVRSVSDLPEINSTVDNPTTMKSYPPEFCHQHFGETETIFGFKHPTVELFYSACDLSLCIRFTHEGTISEQHPDMKPDDVIALIKEYIPFKFEISLETFAKNLTKSQESFKLPGTILNSFSIDNDTGRRNFVTVSLGHPSEPGLVELNQRMESLAFWYIDAASYTDKDDEKWHYYVMYEKYKNGSEERYALAGYAAVYDYYAYPEHIRPRIGHILVLPPFRRCGLGTRLLQAVYDDLVPNPKVVDIVAEDPSDYFIHLRDFVDCVNCSRLPSFRPDVICRGYSKEMQMEAHKRLKLPVKQIRRVYEILRLKHTDCREPEELKKYRLEVKNRLNAPYQQKKLATAKWVKVLNAEELAATLASMAPEQRMAQLEKQYQDTVEDYRYTLNRLATYSENSICNGTS